MGSVIRITLLLLDVATKFKLFHLVRINLIWTILLVFFDQSLCFDKMAQLLSDCTQINDASNPCIRVRYILFLILSLRYNLNYVNRVMCKEPH